MYSLEYTKIDCLYPISVRFYAVKGGAGPPYGYKNFMGPMAPNTIPRAAIPLALAPFDRH